MSTAGNPLIQEFNTWLHLVNKYSSNLPSERDRRLAIQWSNKLKDFSARNQDLKLRNRIAAALVMQMQIGVLQAPFDDKPRFTSLDQVQPIPDLTAKNVFPENFKLPFMMANSPDQGAFLVSQPVPKCGAFCYLAVVSRPPNQ